MNSEFPSVPPLLRTARPIRPAPLIICACAAAVAAIILFFFNPAQTAIYPLCQFKALTGLDCPGCGSLRALHQLLHGNVVAAFQLNALLVSALPFAVWMGGRVMFHALTGHGQTTVIRPAWLWIAFAVTIVFGIVRNLHLSCLSWMTC